MLGGNLPIRKTLQNLFINHLSIVNFCLLHFLRAKWFTVLLGSVLHLVLDLTDIFWILVRLTVLIGAVTKRYVNGGLMCDGRCLQFLLTVNLIHHALVWEKDFFLLLGLCVGSLWPEKDGIVDRIAPRLRETVVAHELILIILSLFGNSQRLSGRHTQKLPLGGPALYRFTDRLLLLFARGCCRISVCASFICTSSDTLFCSTRWCRTWDALFWGVRIILLTNSKVVCASGCLREVVLGQYTAGTLNVIFWH